MKKLLTLSIISSCITLHLFGDTKAFEGAVRIYCTQGKTPALAQQVLNTTQGWKQKDTFAANTFTKQYGCVKKNLDAFLAELREQIKAAAIPVAPAVPALSRTPYVRPIPAAPAIPTISPVPYVRPIPTTPAVPQFAEGELVPEVPTLTPEQEQASATSAANKEALYLIGELEKTTSDKEINDLERQASELRNLSADVQAALKQAIESARKRLMQQTLEHQQLEEKIANFTQVLDTLRLSLSEDAISKNLAATLPYLRDDKLIPWSKLNREDAQQVLDKLKQRKQEFESLLEPQLLKLAFKAPERSFVFAMRRATEAINKAIENRQATLS